MMEWGDRGKAVERREPVFEPTDSRESVSQHWGNLRFRRRRSGPPLGTPVDNAESRFWIGVGLFLLVALLYPWYSYWVNARLLTLDLKAAGQEFERQLKASAEQARQQAAATDVRRQSISRQQRIAAVRVVGAVPSSTGPIVIVRLGQASLSEATPTICRQAEGMLGMSLGGERLRVQRHRGGQATEPAGAVRC